MSKSKQRPAIRFIPTIRNFISRNMIGLVGGLVVLACVGCSTTPKTGTVFNESTTYVDPDTGYTVRKVTANGIYNVGPTYHLNTAFTADSRYVVFVSMREGRTYLMRADTQTGDIKVLFTGPDLKQYDEAKPVDTIKHSGPRLEGNLIALNQKTSQVAVVVNYLYDIWLVDVNTGKAVQLEEHDKRPGERPKTPSFTKDGKYLIVPTAMSTKETAKIPYRERLTFPLKYYKYDTASGKRELFYNEEKWGHAHAQQSSSDPNLWVIPLGRPAWIQKDRDKARRESNKIHTYNSKTGVLKTISPLNEYKESSHISFNFDGSRINYHGPAANGGMYIGVSDLDGNSVWEHVFRDWTYHKHGSNHVSSHTQNNIIIEDGISKANFINLVDYSNSGKSDAPVVTPLARHDNEWGKLPGQFTHPHAHMSPDGRWVSFNTCKNGRTDLYLIDLQSTEKNTQKGLESK